MAVHVEAGNLPVGFRFGPTDDELVIFLMRKAFGILDHPTPNIQDFNVFQTEPWNLPKNPNTCKGQKYFFLDIRGKNYEHIDIRAAGNGEWKMVEKHREVSFPNPNILAKKNTFVFWKMHDSNTLVKTRWMMDEICLATKNPAKISAWNAYRVYREKKKKGKGKNSAGSTRATVIDPPSPSPISPK